eukprot:jgi/Chrzof1/12591/Cz07g00070.t1
MIPRLRKRRHAESILEVSAALVTPPAASCSPSLKKQKMKSFESAPTSPAVGRESNQGGCMRIRASPPRTPQGNIVQACLYKACKAVGLLSLYRVMAPQQGPACDEGEDARDDDEHIPAVPDNSLHAASPAASPCMFDSSCRVRRRRSTPPISPSLSAVGMPPDVVAEVCITHVVPGLCEWQSPSGCGMAEALGSCCQQTSTTSLHGSSRAGKCTEQLDAACHGQCLSASDNNTDGQPGSWLSPDNQPAAHRQQQAFVSTKVMTTSTSPAIATAAAAAAAAAADATSWTPGTPVVGCQVQLANTPHDPIMTQLQHSQQATTKANSVAPLSPHPTDGEDTTLQHQQRADHNADCPAPASTATPCHLLLSPVTPEVLSPSWQPLMTPGSRQHLGNAGPGYKTGRRGAYLAKVAQLQQSEGKQAVGSSSSSSSSSQEPRQLPTQAALSKETQQPKAPGSAPITCEHPIGAVHARTNTTATVNASPADVGCAKLQLSGYTLHTPATTAGAATAQCSSDSSQDTISLDCKEVLHLSAVYAHGRQAAEVTSHAGQEATSSYCMPGHQQEYNIATSRSSCAHQLPSPGHHAGNREEHATRNVQVSRAVPAAYGIQIQPFDIMQPDGTGFPVVVDVARVLMRQPPCSRIETDRPALTRRVTPNSHVKVITPFYHRAPTTKGRHLVKLAAGASIHQTRPKSCATGTPTPNMVATTGSSTSTPAAPVTLEQAYRTALLNLKMVTAASEGACWAKLDMAGMDILSTGTTEQYQDMCRRAHSRLSACRQRTDVAALESQLEKEWSWISYIRRWAAVPRVQITCAGMQHAANSSPKQLHSILKKASAVLEEGTASRFHKQHSSRRVRFYAPPVMAQTVTSPTGSNNSSNAAAP